MKLILLILITLCLTISLNASEKHFDGYSLCITNAEAKNGTPIGITANGILWKIKNTWFIIIK
jgi:hypothetical protein